MNVFYLSLKEDTPCRGYWDYGILDSLLVDFEAQEVKEIPKLNFAIVVIPARSHFKLIKEINEQLSNLNSVVLFLMGDEEGSFKVNKIKHSNIKIYVQNPSPDLDKKYRKLGCGYPPKIKDIKELPSKKLDWFFAGQVTHKRREKCIKSLENLKNGKLITSKKFTGDLPQEKYYEKLANSKVAPCPSGPETVDTFRFFEALELGCVPIVDNETPKKDWTGFWEWLFDGPVPFPTINDYESLPGYIKDCANQFPSLNNKIQAWWFRQKSKLKNKVLNDIFELTEEKVGSQISVIIPISPIKSHPKTEIIEETIASIKHHLPNAEIIITFDGVRKEQKKMRSKYEEHIRKVLWLSRFWGKVTPYIFENHIHQSGMMREIIDKIETPILLYVEQDTPIVKDEIINFDFLQNKILSGDSNVIRLHHEALILKEHQHLVLGNPEDNLLKTIQWSQRPHLASTAFYKRILSELFSPKSKCFLEDLIHGKVLTDYYRYREQGWLQWRLHIYYPEGNIKRSYHTDGRKSAKKYDNSQIW